MTEDAARAGERGEARLDEGRELAHDVAVHPVVARPGLAGGVEIEAGAGAEVPVVVLAGQSRAAGTRVRHDEHEAVTAGVGLGARLDGGGLLGAGEPRQVVEHGHGTLFRRRGHVDGEPHLRPRLRGRVTIEALGAPEAPLLADGLEAHGGEAA